ncbi:MAG TPA: hypothetical protein VI382_02705 [Candidatus Manganitrophaceae bacterium]|nr:hypothetical protein [Candidatus Manganitrophaceae bacterium]
MSKGLRRFLIFSGCVLFAVGIGRLSSLFQSRSTDSFFAPHLLVTLLSLWIATSILRVGFRKKEMTVKAALSLIRSGSILLMIWSYRLYLVLRTVQSPLDLKAHLYLAVLYMVLGTLVMVSGLKLSRSLRKKGAPVSPAAPPILPILADTLTPVAGAGDPFKK